MPKNCAKSLLQHQSNTANFLKKFSVLVFKVFLFWSQTAHFDRFQAVISLTLTRIELESCMGHIMEALSLSFHYFSMWYH